MLKTGLFTRQDLKKSRRPPPKQEIDLSRARSLGPKAVRSMNPAARYPEMEPEGSDRPLVYVLGEAPGEEEDNAGRPFVGKAGDFLKDRFPVDFEDMTRFNNCVRTRPPDNRDPIPIEIECFPGDTLVSPIGGIQKVYRRWYKGSLIEIRTAQGKFLSATPNHPIFTLNGKVAAKDIKIGDYLPNTGTHASTRWGAPNVYNKPTPISEIFRSFSKVFEVERTMGSSLDFHGDGKEGYVDIIRADSFLGNGIKSFILQEGDHFKFSRSYSTPGSLMSSGSFDYDASIIPVHSSTLGVLKGVGPIPSFSTFGGGSYFDPFSFEVPDNSLIKDSFRFSNSFSALPGQIPSDNISVGSKFQQTGLFRSGSQFYTPFNKSFANSSGVGSNFLREVVYGSTFDVELDKVVSVTVKTEFCGHIFNLQTESGKYIAESLLVGNCFRDSVIEDIERTKPKVILGVGTTPLYWFLGKEAPRVWFARGRYYPVTVGKHKCWFFSTWHPKYISRLDRSSAYIEDVPAGEVVRQFDFDIERCFEEAEQLPEPEIEDLDTLYDGTKCYDGWKSFHFKRVCKFLKSVKRSGELFAIDLETNRGRPYKEGAKILTISIAVSDRSISYALDHPQSGFTIQQRKRLTELLIDLLKAPNPRVAHNASFDLEWLTYLYGREILTGGIWHCTMAQAYVLDERAGKKKGEAVLNLNFLTMSMFGFFLKHQSDLDRNRLEFTDLKLVLKYNALDGKYGRKLYWALRRHIKAEELELVYKIQRQRIPSIVEAQVRGLPLNNEVIEGLSKDLAADIVKVDAKIKETEAVKSYTQRHGSFLVTSTDHLKKMFRDHLKRDEGNKQLGGYSTEEKALKLMTDEPLAQFVLERRALSKLKGTYVDTLLVSNKKTVAYPDNRLHPQFKPCFTNSGRLSCEDPNAQNWPIRKYAKIRKCIEADPGCVLLAFDFGALEYRGIGMESQDKVIVDSCWSDYDVHMAWTERLLKMKPSLIRNYQDDKKKMRAGIKNQLVFPAFYLSSERSITEAIGLTEHQGHVIFEEFWDLFKGVKRWQMKKWNFYCQNLYVEGLTGRRRHGPLSRSMCVNSPVQGLGSDIVVDAMYRLHRLSILRDIPWIAPILNIHDDLTFMVPRKRLDDAIHYIVPEMCRTTFDFVNVPILIEGKVGRNWFEMKELAKFRSDRLKKQLHGYEIPSLN